jgi:hypothetical protein
MVDSEISQWLKEKTEEPYKGIKVISSWQGSGKTWAICEYAAKSKKRILILTPEHKHIVEEIIPFLKQNGCKDSDIRQWVGLEKSGKCFIFQNNTSEVSILDEMKEKKISVSLFCGSCRYKKICDYKKQFKNLPRIVCAPVEYVKLRWDLMANFEECFVDENIDKITIRSFRLDNSKIAKLFDSTDFIHVINAYNKTKKEKINPNNFTHSLQKESKLILQFSKAVQSHSLEKNNLELPSKKSGMYVRKDNNSFITHRFIELLDFDTKDSKFKSEQDLYHKIFEEKRQGFYKKLNKLLMFCLKNKNFNMAQKILKIQNIKNYDFDRNWQNISELPEDNFTGILKDAFLFPLLRNENVNTLGISEIGKSIEGGNSFFDVIIPDVWSIFKLSELMPISMVSATFNKEIFEEQKEMFDNYFGKNVEYSTNTPNFTPQKSESIIFRIIRHGGIASWAWSTTKDKAQFFRENIQALLDYSDDFCMISKEEFCSEKSDSVMRKRLNYSPNYIHNKCRFYFGSGAKGTNVFVKKKYLILFFTPNLDTDVFIGEYVKNFGRIPQNLVWESKINTKAGKVISEKHEIDKSTRRLAKGNRGALVGYTEKNMDVLFNQITNKTIIDAVFRLRDTDKEKKYILAFCNVPPELEKHFTVIDIQLPVITNANTILRLLKQQNSPISSMDLQKGVSRQHFFKSIKFLVELGIVEKISQKSSKIGKPNVLYRIR